MANGNDSWKQSLHAAFNPESIFYSEAERKNGTLDEMEIDQIVPFKNHTFKVLDDAKMMELVESVKDHGVNEPALVFMNEDGNMEMISGHRRKRACELAGISTIPVIVKEISRDEATILMGESNLQSRDEILPSERAFTYKEMLNAMKRQGKRTDLTFGPVDQKLNARKEAAEIAHTSEKTIDRYIRLTYLIPELLELVDLGKMAIRPAVEVSYMDSACQKAVHSYYQDTLLVDDKGMEIAAGVLPSLAQAKEMRALSSGSALDEEKVQEILGKPKPNQKPKITINSDKVMKYQRDLTPSQFEDKIMRALEFYEKYHEKAKNQREL